MEIKFVYTLEHCLAVKETEIMTFSGIWMELERITMEKESSLFAV